ncbi:MAG TPA: T9SS type A sorting domain-containing protein [bacterium]
MIPPGGFRTYTQGGWGASCHGGNPGCIRDDNWSAIFPLPNGLIVGGTYTIQLTTSAAANAFIPAGGTPGVLTANLVNPTSSPAGVFAGQLVALALTLEFSNAGVPGFNPAFGSLVVQSGVHNPTGAFAGWSVSSIFALANQVLGGNVGALPAGISVSDLNNVLTSINQNFDNGTVSEGYLMIEGCDQILPVEMASFEASVSDGAVVVEWRTASESQVSSFEISRSVNGSDWQSLVTVNSQGSSPSGFSYRYTDASVIAGTPYSYRLAIHELDGSTVQFSHIASATPNAAHQAASYELAQNYPNPFNPTTTISYTLKEAGMVNITVFDVMGRTVATLARSAQTSGVHSVSFDGTGLSSGVYFYRLESGSFTDMRKMMLLK